MTTHLEISSYELLAFTIALEFITAGRPLNDLEPHRQLNARTGRLWTPVQWLQILQPACRQMVGAAHSDQPIATSAPR